jgi:hypothetical protein
MAPNFSSLVNLLAGMLIYLIARLKKVFCQLEIKRRAYSLVSLSFLSRKESLGKENNPIWL